MRQPRPRVQLEHESVGIAVKHQPRESVVLAVDASVRSRLVRIDRCAHFHRLGYRVAPEVTIDLPGPTAMQHLHHDRRIGVIETDRRKLSLVVENHGEVAGASTVGPAADRFDRTVVDPRMAGANLTQCIRREPNCEPLF